MVASPAVGSTLAASPVQALHAIGLGAALAACSASPRDLPSPTATHAAVVEPAAASRAATTPGPPRFIVAKGKLVDVETLEVVPLPSELAALAISGDTAFFVDASRIRAHDPIGKRDRWSTPLPDELSGVATEVVPLPDLALVLGQHTVGGFDRSTGKPVFITTLPDVAGITAAHGGTQVPTGLLVQLGDAAAFIVDRRGSVASLPPPSPDPSFGEGGVLALGTHPTREGACVQYMQSRTQAFALRCFDAKGAVRWERGWEIPGRPGGSIEPSQAPWIGASSPAHLLLTTQGNESYASHRARVYATADGALELEHPGALGTLVESEDGALLGAIDASHERASFVDSTGKEVWSIPNRWGGLVTSARIDADLVLAAHPMVSDRSFFEIVRVERATGRERWRTRIDMPSRSAQMIGAIAFVPSREHLGVTVRTSATRLTTALGFVLDLGDGRVLASLVE